MSGPEARVRASELLGGQVTEPKPNATASSAPAKRGKQGLPRTSLKGAEEAALKLWEVARAGKTAKEAFARELRITSIVGNGAWDRKLAMLNLYGLIEQTENQIGLSALGLDLVQDSDPDKRRDARRRAVRKVKAFDDLIGRFDGTELPTMDRLTSTLRFEYQKTEDQAAKAAEAFVESLAFAELLDASRVVHRHGPPSVAAGGDGTDDDDPDDEPDDEEESAPEALASEGEADASSEPGSEVARGMTPRGRRVTSDLASDRTLTVTLDLSSFRADEVIQILRELGFARG